MKKAFSLLLLLCASIASATTLVPVQLLNPAGSTAGQVVVSNGPVTAPGWANVAATSLAAQAANTVVANVTGSSASPTAFPMPSCSTSASALNYALGTGWTCNTSVNAATLGGATFAAPGPIGSTTASSGAFTTLAASGILTSTNSTASSSSTTGAITTAGGIGVTGNINVGGTINGGGTVAGVTGQFASLSASSTVSGAGFSTYLASPPAIGGTAPASGTFTTLKGNSLAKVFATNTSGQSIPNNAQTTVTGWTSVRDANSNFVASTGIFTAPASADYLVCAQLIIGGAGASNGVLQATIIANGSAWATFNAPVWSSTVTDTTVSGCTETNVSSGQTITVQLLQNSGSAQALSTATKQVFLSIVQIP